MSSDFWPSVNPLVPRPYLNNKLQQIEAVVMLWIQAPTIHALTPPMQRVGSPMSMRVA